MVGRVEDSIRRGLDEAIAFVEGKADASRYRVHIPDEIDVKAIQANSASER